MNTKNILEIASAIVVGALVIWFIGTVSGGRLLSSQINYNQSLSNVNLYTELASLATDITNMRAALTNNQTVTSSTYTMPTFSQPNLATSTIAGFTGNTTAGDPVVVSISTTSALAAQSGIVGTGVISNTTSTALITWYVTTPGQTVSSSTYTLPTFVTNSVTSTLGGFTGNTTAGDPVVISVNSSTQPGVEGVGTISGTTSTAVITWVGANPTSTFSGLQVAVKATVFPTAAPTLSGLQVSLKATVLPTATTTGWGFNNPPALVTTTSTSQ